MKNWNYNHTELVHRYFVIFEPSWLLTGLFRTHELGITIRQPWGDSFPPIGFVLIGPGLFWAMCSCLCIIPDISTEFTINRSSNIPARWGKLILHSISMVDEMMVLVNCLILLWWLLTPQSKTGLVRGEHYIVINCFPEHFFSSYPHDWLVILVGYPP